MHLSDVCHCRDQAGAAAHDQNQLDHVAKGPEYAIHIDSVAVQLAFHTAAV